MPRPRKAMDRRNIRTVNGAQHNPHLDPRYVRVQNRAAAVLDAWVDYGDPLPIDLIAHMHRLPVEQIKKDLYGEPDDIKQRYGLKSTLKLERVLKRCLKELDDGQDRTLVAVANHIPFALLRSLEIDRNVKNAAKKFLDEIRQKLQIGDDKENVGRNTAELDKVSYAMITKDNMFSFQY